MTTSVPRSVPVKAPPADRSPVTEADAVRLAAQVPWEDALPPRAHRVSWRAERAVKRLLDILLSAVALALLLPVYGAIALCIALDSTGPIFYRWRVLGLHGRPFTGYKFRTMVVDADALKEQLTHLNEMNGPAFKIRNDPRVTRVGRWLRRFSLDELPQLWSVAVGDMSLVGPRPPSAGEFVRFTPEQRLKLAVTPGITCLWQVSGRANITDFEDWARLDRSYIAEWNLVLDLKVLLRTIPAVIRGSGAY